MCEGLSHPPKTATQPESRVNILLVLPLIKSLQSRAERSPDNSSNLYLSTSLLPAREELFHGVGQGTVQWYSVFSVDMPCCSLKIPITLHF